jgi:flagellar hook-length control protein FliK
VDIARGLASRIPDARLALLEGASLAPYLEAARAEFRLTVKAYKQAAAKGGQTQPLPDANALVQQMARTRSLGDNAPATARQMAGASTQGANAEHASASARRAESFAHTNVTQAATQAVADATSNAGSGGNASAQADAQGAGAKFGGVFAHAMGDASTSAPTFAVGATGVSGTAGTANDASITPAQTHTLPTFGDAAWPHSMASQLAYMQVHRQSSAELQLNPAELGGLRVKLDVDNGAVNASFVCQHQAVAELVQDAMPRLRDAMQQGGMQLAQTSVSTGDFNQQGAGQGASAQGNGSGNGGGNGSRFGGGAQGQADSSTVAVSTPRVSTHDGAIDTFA